jgi:acid phosphatase
VAALPRPDHIVVVVMENRSYSDIISNPSAPYINALARSGALFTRSFAVSHPSEPNYLALFSGSAHHLADDSCPHAYGGPNLAASVIAAGGTFTGYAESLPHAGYRGCQAGHYARKHAPWVNFSSVPPRENQPFSAFPRDLAALPTLSFVAPNLDDDMHDGTIARGDQWLHRHLGRYAKWARTHNSLLVLTWDEDDRSQGNRIPTVIAGAHVTSGRYSERVTHYRLLRTLEYGLGLAPIGVSAQTTPVQDIWSR